jgi:chromosome segregation ATPase
MSDEVSQISENLEAQEKDTAVTPFEDDSSENPAEEEEEDPTTADTMPEENPTSYELEMTRLQELVEMKQAENSSLELKLIEQSHQSKLQVEQLHQNFTLKLEQTLKKFQEMQKSTTSSMVMKYADAEKRCIDLNQKLHLAQTKLADSNKEKAHLTDRLSKAKQEMDKLNADYDQRVKEIIQIKKDNQLNEAKESKARLLLKKPETRDQETCTDNNIVNNSDYSTGGELTQQLPLPTPSAPIPAVVNSANTSKDKDRMTKELELLKSQLKDMFEERTLLRDKLQTMDHERKIQDLSFAKYKETLQNQKQMNKELLNECLQLRELQETVTKEQSEKVKQEQKLKQLELDLSELQLDLASSQTSQNDLLSFTSKLTEKNTQLQSEKTSLTEKLDAIQHELTKSTQLLQATNNSLQLDKTTLQTDVAERTK